MGGVSWAWLLVWACGCYTTTSTHISVGMESSQCAAQDSQLLCDFEGVRETVLMVEALGEAVRDVVILNAPRLHLSESLCVNVSLSGCREVVVVRGSGHSCLHNIHLAANGTNLDRLPSTALWIQLVRTRVATLTSPTAIRSLELSQCIIDVMDINEPVSGPDTVVDIKDSTIKKLERLEMGPQSRFRMERSAIEVVASKGLMLLTEEVTMKESSVWSLERDSIVLGIGAAFSLENCPGYFKVSTTLTDKSRQAANYEETAVAETNFLVLFAICLVVCAILCIVVVVLCIKIRNERYYASAVLDISYNRSPVRRQLSNNISRVGAGKVCDSRTKLMPKDNVREAAERAMNKYVMETVRTSEVLKTLRTQAMEEINGLKYSKNQKMVELNSKYSTLRNLQDEEPQSPVRAQRRNLSNGYTDELTQTQETKESLLESQYEDKVLEVLVSLWHTENQEVEKLIKAQELCIGELKSNRDSVLGAILGPSEPDWGWHTEVINILSPRVAKVDKDFKDQQQIREFEHQEEQKRIEADITNRLKTLEKRYDIATKAIADEDKSMSLTGPRNRGIYDFPQTLRNLQDITYQVEQKRISSEADPCLHLRQQREVLAAQDKLIGQLEIIVEFAVVVGKMTPEKVEY